MQYHKGEQAYLDLLRDILANGQEVSDRTGVGTRSVFGRQLRFDLTAGFPLLTTKRLHSKSIIVELLWFLRGDTNVDFLHQHGVTIWDEWADANGDLGPVYGRQWRSWPCYVDYDEYPLDQITNVINSLRDNPHSRRHIVVAWNPAEVDSMALPPCHCLFQFYVRKISDINVRLNTIEHLDRQWLTVPQRELPEWLDAQGVPKYYLDCQLYQRSADTFLGIPFNIASYALLTHMIAQQVNMIAGEFIHTIGDAHIYNNHVPMVETQLSRSLLNPPKLQLNKAESIFDYTLADVKFLNYGSHPAIKAPIAV